jgi:hypothetical protein
MENNRWNGMEIAKLLVGAATPIVLLIFTIQLNHSEWMTQRLSEKRLDVYTKAAPILNQTITYFLCVGKWKDGTPDKMVGNKRELDELVYTNAPLFSPDFFEKYGLFTQAAFDIGNGRGTNAMLRTKADYYSGVGGWNPEWGKQFTNEDNSSKARAAYQQFMLTFVRNISPTLQGPIVLPDSYCVE